MSFILDALKKSDAERQKRSTPGVADIPVARDRRPPQRWLWVVGALLAVNLVALFVLLLRPDPPPVVAETPRAAPTTAAPQDRTSSRPFADMVAEARRRTEPAPATPSRRDERPATVAGTTPEPAAEPQAAANTAAGSAGATVETENPAEAANTFESLRADGTLTLPDLHLDVHVYSEQRDERFVFINTKKYRENETLAEGPIVTRIAPEGVVLEYRGTVFLLPRE